MPHTGEELIALHGPMASERFLYEAKWRDVSFLAVPSRSTEENGTRGRDRSVKTYDNTAMVAADRLAAGISGLMTSPALEWMLLQPLDPNVDDDDALAWMDDAQQFAFAVFRSPTSGFQSALNESYLDDVGFGTSAIFTDFVVGRGIQYRTVPLDELFIANGGDGRVNTIFRLKKFTAAQAAEFFGKENLSSAAKKDLEGTERLTKQREYFHVVLPRGDKAVRGMSLGINKPFASIYLDKDAAHIVREGGFDEMPYAVSRWKIASGEVYGTSPAMDVMDEIRLINVLKKIQLVAGDKASDPPLQVSDNTVLGRLRSGAGGVTYVRHGAEIKQIPTGDPRVSGEMIAEARAFIDRGFFQDILNLPLQDRMTATEVVERRSDKLQTLSPFAARLQEEKHSPLIGRTLAIAIRQGMLRPPPPSLGAGIRVEYVSPLAISQKSSQVQATSVWINQLLPLAQIDPDVMEGVKTEEFARFSAEALHVPRQLVRSVEEIQQRREAKEQERQEANAVTTGREVAETAKTAAEASAVAGSIGLG